MILEDENWSLGYDTLLEESRPGNGRDEQRTILILCNADVDAMASARIITYLLRSDAIPYQLLPCTSYPDLKETLQSLQDQMEQFSAIVLLNFGACYNLTKLYLPQHQNQAPLVPESIKFFVLDCRRPVHLANVYEESAIVVFMNESKETIDHFPSDGDDLSGVDDDDDDEVEEDSDDDNSDSDSDSDSEQEKEQSDDEEEEQASFDDVEGSAPSIKQKKKSEDKDDGDNADYDGEDEESNDETIAQRFPKKQKTEAGPQDQRGEQGGDDDDDDIIPSQDDSQSPSQDQQQQLQPLSQRELRHDRTQRLIRYYDQGSYFAAPASFMAYRMAEQLRQGEEGDLLWLACVGVTDAYLHARVDRYGFGECGHVLKNSCLKLFPDTRVDRALNSFNAEHLNGSHVMDGPKTKIKFSDNGKIMAQDDYRFFLLRHSSLLDSMLYSEYVYSKLQMNTKKGQQKFMEMLAKMGLPLDECRQPFRFMKTSLRSRLKSEFETHAEVSEVQCRMKRFQSMVLNDFFADICRTTIWTLTD